MKVLVTGGSGFLGTHIRKFFNADDFSRRSNFDMLNANDVSVVEDYDMVIHLAAHLDKSPEASEQCFLVNVEGTVNILRAMRENAVFVFASTKDVYGKFADDFDEIPETCPTDYHGQSALEWSKLIAERYVEFYATERNFRACVFRLSTVFAPSSAGNEPNFVTHYVDAIKNGDEFRLPWHGAPKRDLLYVDDFALACRTFADSDLPYGLYNVGGGRENALTLRELVAKIENLTGKKAVLDSAVSPLPTPRNYVSDLQKIRFDTGWSPTISIDEGLKKII
jgi:nucleoside-diphosphate-sugar epimerase